MSVREYPGRRGFPRLLKSTFGEEMFFSVVSDFCCGKAKEDGRKLPSIPVQFYNLPGYAGGINSYQIKFYIKKGEKTCTKVIPWN